MKIRQLLFPLPFVTVAALLLLYACRKDFDLASDVVHEVPYDDTDVLAKAQEWYKNNVQWGGKHGDVDVRLLTPVWDQYYLGTNSMGQPWISVPLKNKAHTDVFLTELSLVIDKKGRANGIIKEFKNNPYIGDSELTIYIGNGKLYKKGIYSFKRRAMFVKRTGAFLSGKDKLYQIAYGQKYAMERRSLKFVAASGGSNGDEDIAWESEIEEVIIPPPPGGGGPGGNPWEDPWEGYNPWESGDGGDNDEGGSSHEAGAGSGGGSGSGSGNGDGAIPIEPTPWNGDQQQIQTDKEPTTYEWRPQFEGKELGEVLEETTPQFIYDPEGNWMANADAFNCHYYTFSDSDPNAIIATLADQGNPKWVVSVNLRNWDKVISNVQVGDIVMYFGLAGNSHGFTHSGIVIQVDAEGYATQISSKMGQYEIITHHPRDVPAEYGSTEPTYIYEEQWYPSREYYRKKSN